MSEISAPTQGEMASESGNSTDNSWVTILLGAIGIYLLLRTSKKKGGSNDSKGSKIDSYSKFKSTPMGSSIDLELKDEGIQLSANQIEKLDKCLQGLTDEEYKIIAKASQFIKKEDLYKALDKEEMKVFLPVRKKILDCVDDVLNA
jgi:hypothetical protein